MALWGWARRLIGSAVAVLAVSMVAGCASLPAREPPPPSQAYADTGNTTLARIARASLPAAAAADISGFRLLPIGEHSIDGRLALAERAERSVDAQYYHVHADPAGATFLRSLRDAALRGVRVRLLVDDYHAADIYPLLRGLAAYPGVEVRLFNPLPARSGMPLQRMLLSVREFARVNHRMHNKLFLADNQVALYGGRNIADEYFYRSAQANFVDLDVVSVGAVVPELSASFDRYWNSAQAWSLRQLLPARAGALEEQQGFDALSKPLADALLPLDRGPADPLRQTDLRRQLAEGRLLQHPGRARVHDDPPDKVGRPVVPNQPSAAMQGKLDVIAAARDEVVIVNPYFMPGPVGMAMMEQASRRGTSVLIVTNSLDSTDEPLVHRAYSRFRAAMLRLGMKLYEFSPDLARKSGSFGDYEHATLRLHAKVAAVDRRWLLVGSVNLDARSAILNTELGVSIDCPVVAQQAVAMISGDGYASMYRLALAPDEQGLLWHAQDPERGALRHTEEPGLNRWLEFKLWLQSLVVAEESL
jgi:cardiolipin synthase C